MAPVTIDAGARNSYYSAGNVGWSARSLFAYRTAIQQLVRSADTFWGNAATSSALAQSFTPATNIDVAHIRVPVFKNGTPSDTVSLQIWSDTGANLPNASIATADNSFVGTAVSTSASWLEFQFNTPVALTGSTKYWFVLQRSGAVDSANYYNTAYSSASLYAGGGMSGLVSGTWGAESSTNDLAFQILTETPSALYAVTQSTEPALHVWKSTDSGATWSEQDAADNPTVTSATHPFDACDTRSGPYIGTAFFTAANTVRARLFDMSTDQWGTDLGAADASTISSNERSIRVNLDNTFTTATCGSQYVSFTDSGTDDADLGYARRTTGAWGATGNSIVGSTSTEASLYANVVCDKTPIGFLHHFYYFVSQDDFGMRSVVATTVGTDTDIVVDAADVETEHASATYQIYQASNVDKIIAAFINADGSIQERTAQLEVTSASVTLGTEHAVGTATTTAGRQLSTCAYDGDGYVVSSVSGTGIDYYVDSGLAGSWSAATNWKTGLTSSTLSQVINVPGIGLGVVYTDNGDAKIDWIDGGPASDVTINGSHATASALANASTTATDIQGSNATATALANSGSISIKPTASLATATGLANAGTVVHAGIAGALATADAEAFAGTAKLAYHVDGSLATADALANAGSLSIKPAASLAAASALANAGTLALDLTGSLATGSAEAFSGALFSDVAGALATADALANAGTVRTGVFIDGSLSTADALANSGAIAIDIQGSNAVTTSALAFSGSLSIKPAASLATASALALDGTVALDMPGALALASALAFDGASATDIVGVTATASAEAFFGTQEVGVTIQGSLATATAEAFDGTTQEGAEISEGDRYRFFQIRPLPTGY
jgi:hypothetical protein